MLKGTTKHSHFLKTYSKEAKNKNYLTYIYMELIQVQATRNITLEAVLHPKQHASCETSPMVKLKQNIIFVTKHKKLSINSNLGNLIAN